MSYKDKILERINAFDEEKVFVAEDFLDISTYETARKCLTRLEKEKKILRVVKGYYYKACYSDFLKEFEAPNVEEFLNTLSRRYGWKISPSENSALNLLGLCTQVPSKCVYLSTGPYRVFKIGNLKIELKHRASKIVNFSPLTALVISALKGRGKNKVSEKDIQILRSKLTKEDKELLLLEGEKTINWIFKEIKKVCEHE